MRRIEEARRLIESLAGQDLSEAELIERSRHFFDQNLSELDAEFATGLLKAKAAGGGEAVLPFVEDYAAGGAPAAQLMLGILMLHGKGVTKNQSEALFWLKRSFDGENPNAGFLLGCVYLGDSGVAQDFCKARRYMKASAYQGVPKAQYYYGWMLREGKGGPINHEEALVYMKKAAAAGHEGAIEALDGYYAEE